MALGYRAASLNGKIGPNGPTLGRACYDDLAGSDEAVWVCRMFSLGDVRGGGQHFAMYQWNHRANSAVTRAFT